MPESDPSPTPSPAPLCRVPGIYSDHIRDDGTVDDRVVETYFRRADGLQLAEPGYVRVFIDDGGTDIETRIPVASLEALGVKCLSSASEELAKIRELAGNEATIGKLLDLLERIEDAPDDSWVRDYYTAIRQPMILTEEGWEDPIAAAEYRKDDPEWQPIEALTFEETAR